MVQDGCKPHSYGRVQAENPKAQGADDPIGRDGGMLTPARPAFAGARWDRHAMRQTL